MYIKRIDQKEMNQKEIIDLRADFFEKLGSPIIVECRNREGPFSAKDIEILREKLEILGLNMDSSYAKKA
ncbi:hypothetical protein [Methanolobus psychrotolerans]|uniref:hypothetical protein n=1 Tax=Methanolobus psychrotolerans TaxID=1874706 RepID=UPI000B91ACF6|nr:hypothetical protein [Methanolobus psychrotolerans]